MIMAGWIKIYRSFKEWQHYGNPVMVQLFLHLLLSANYEDVERNGMILKRGQYLTSIKKLASDLGITVKVARNYLMKLVKTGEILKDTVSITMGTTFGTTSGTTKAPTLSLITICNYERYQDMDSNMGTTSGTTSGTYIKNNIKNNKENNNNSSLRSEINIAHDDGFDEFWTAYDYKKSKATAQKAWRNLSKKDREAAMQGVEPYKQDCRRCQRSMQYAATYLHKRTWEDDFTKTNDYGNNRRSNPIDNIERAQQQAIAESMELIRKAKERDSQI